MNDQQPYHFLAPVLLHPSGMRQHYIPVPEEVGDFLTARRVRRLILSLNGHQFRRAFHNSKEVGPCLLMSKALLRDLGVSYGDTIVVELAPDPDPDHVEMAEEFSLALAQDPEAAERFYGMTPGRRRSIAHYVNSAKRTETRIKRSLELVYKLRTYTLHLDKLKES